MTTIAVQEINGPYEPSSDTTPFSTLTWTAASAGTDNVIIPDKRVLLLFRNSGASTRTIAIASSYDAFGRKADIPATNIGAGLIFGRFLEPRGWEQELGSKNVEFACSHAEVLVAAIAI
jgi:hypothetical protein